MSFMLVGEIHNNRQANLKIGGIIAKGVSVRNFRLLAEGPITSRYERNLLLGSVLPSDAYSRFLTKWLNSFSAQTGRPAAEAANLFLRGQAQALREYLSERQIGLGWPVAQIEPIASTCDFLCLDSHVLYSRLASGSAPTETASEFDKAKAMVIESLEGEPCASKITQLLRASADYLGMVLSTISTLERYAQIFSPQNDFFELDLAMSNIWKIRSEIHAKNAIVASERMACRRGGWCVATLTGVGHIPEILGAIEASDSEIAKSAAKKAVFFLDRSNPAINPLIRKNAEQAKAACESLQIEFV